MKKTMFLSIPVLIGVILFAVPSMAAAADWYVNYGTGTPNSECSEANPCGSVDDLPLAGFVAGDTIYLAGITDYGIYLGAFSGTADNYSEVMAWPGQTITATGAIDPLGVLVSNATYLDISGITVTGGEGAGIDINETGGEVANVIIHDMDISGAGVGVHINGGDSVIIYGMYIHENLADGIMAQNTSNITIYNSIICDNMFAGINLTSVTTAAVLHNLLCNNSNVAYNVQAVTGTQIQNNVISGNAKAASVADQSSLVADYNDFYQNTIFSDNYATLTDYQTATSLEAHSLEVDPLVVSTTDAHLQSTSPLIDAGTTVEGFAGTDVDGEVRPYGATPDIGLDEYPAVPTPTTVKVKNISVHTGLVKWVLPEGFTASKYKVEYSKNKNFKNAKVERTKKVKVTLEKLKAETTYFVRVTAIYTTDYATYKSVVSETKKFTTKASRDD